MKQPPYSEAGPLAAVRQNPYAIAAAVTFAVRLALIFARHTYVFPSNDTFFFGAETGSIARSIAAGEGFGSPFRIVTGPTAWIAPIYPAMCAAVFKLLGIFSTNSAIAMFSLNSVFSALTCFALGGIARRTIGNRLGTIAAFAWAVLPYFAKWPTEWVWDMSLSALLASCAIWLTLAMCEEQSTARWSLFGGLWAAIALTNPALLTLLPFCAAKLMRPRRPQFWRGAAISACVFVALVTPWMIRNRIALGEWVFLRDNFGFELHLGNYHLSNGMGWRGKHPAANQSELERYKRLGEIEYVRETGTEAKQFIRESPGEFAQLCVTRTLAFWDGSSLGYSLKPWPWTPPVFAGFSLVALLGLVFATLRHVPGAGVFWWMVVYPAPYYITYPQARYRHAIEPMMLLFAVYCVAAFVAAIRERTRNEGKSRRAATL